MTKLNTLVPEFDMRDKNKKALSPFFSPKRVTLPQQNTLRNVTSFSITTPVSVIDTQQQATEEQYKQLIIACIQYQSHLRKKIITELKNMGDKAVRIYNQCFMQIDPFPYGMDGILNPDNKSNRIRVANLRAQNQNLDLALKKYKVISVLINTFDSYKALDQQLSDFRDTFRKCRKTIEQRNDPAGITFLKIILSVFSLGLAVACGIWRPEGKNVSEKIDNIISNPSQLPDHNPQNSH